jgi:hypothetical protein
LVLANRDRIAVAVMRAMRDRESIALKTHALVACGNEGGIGFQPVIG